MKFQGLIPDTIDISQYLTPVETVSVHPAGYFEDRTFDVLSGKNTAAGMPLPWGKTIGQFAFRPSELTVWTGYKGHGKSMMISQILLHAMCAGERVFILSPEFRPEGVLARMARQVARNPHPPQPFVHQVFQWANGRMWLFDHQGSLSPETVIASIRYAIDNHDVTHVLVDSLMKCGIAPDDYLRQKKLVDDLQNIAHQEGVHLHLVAHARKTENDDKPPRLLDVKGTSELCDMAENVLSVWKNKRKLEAQSRGKNERDEEPDALLTIDSQRNGDGWTGSFALWFNRPAFQFVGERHAPPFEFETNGKL